METKNNTTNSIKTKLIQEGDNPNPYCDNACHLIVPENNCGDGIVNGNEQCDDGNNDNTDNCLNTCILAYCGDGYLKDNFEQCDDGNTSNGDGCNILCQKEESPYCGDGIIDKENGEQCDDGNNNNNDACLNNCHIAICGDGYIQK
ncbi:MAG: DUF4215 domain-containing protein [bacterium]|nr:DUF4215 domain-containing protein [bacterium]